MDTTNAIAQQNPPCPHLLTAPFIERLAFLQRHHAVLVEGLGARADTRDPTIVARHLCRSWHAHWRRQANNSDNNNNNKQPLPPLVIAQGDPVATTGIAAISRQVASLLARNGCPGRVVVYIDTAHAQNADWDKAVCAFAYEELTTWLDLNTKHNVVARVERAVDDLIKNKKQHQKLALGQSVRKYALLQEVTKIAIRYICNGEVSILRTMAEIPPNTITSFDCVSVDLGFIHTDKDMVPIHHEEGADCDKQT